MDTQVLAAMARWPDVPAVYGWLSLTESGHWRLHPAGNALKEPGSPGEAITSPQILAFIDRNYDPDAQGQWYFQNGPQRVYVRLDAAPYILHTTTDAATGRLKLRTHTGLNVGEVTALHLDDAGRLYVATDRGPGLIAGRDLPALFEALEPAGHLEHAPSASGPPAACGPQSGDATHDTAEILTACLETGRGALLRSRIINGFSNAVPLHRSSGTALETALGFRRQPQAPQ